MTKMLLFKLLPELLICRTYLSNALWIVLNEISEELGTIDFVGEHGGTASSKGGMAFGGREGDEFLNTSTEMVNGAGSGGFDPKPRW